MNTVTQLHDKTQFGTIINSLETTQTQNFHGAKGSLRPQSANIYSSKVQKRAARNIVRLNIEDEV